tara:strand:- start:461 stop:583 length:123 start_codon:yes stop_codon:yes gene_type:complete
MEKLKQLTKELEDAADAFKVSPSSSTCQRYIRKQILTHKQ